MITRSLIALATVFFLSLMMAAPMVTATAQAPEWNEGDAWAMGKSVDLDAEFAQELQDLEDMIRNSTNPANVVINDFDVQAFASAWILFKVDSVDETEVHLKGSFAAKLTGEAHVSITADMAKAGTYEWGDDVPKERLTASADVEIGMAALLEIEMVLEKDTGAIKSVILSIKASLTGSVNLVNIPNQESNWTSFTVSYEDYDVSMDFNFFMTVNVEFQPALNIYDFPLSVGDEWTIESTATMTGSYGGMLDIEGLPANVEEELFASEMLQNAGVDSFPIDLAEVIQNNDEPAMNDGIIGPESVVIGPMIANCVSQTSVTLPNHGLVSKYTIMIASDVYYYFDGIDWLSSMQEVAAQSDIIEELELPLNIPVDDEMLKMDVASSSQAELEIQEIADYRAQIAGESSDEGSPIDLGTMLLLILGIVAALIVLVAIFFLRKKPKAP